MAEPLDLDRLIEEGLTLYGRGDLDSALLVWERVLSVDPANEQANSYVDYVRMNYDMLTADTGDEAVAPFAIADDNEPEYLIEISEGELPQQRASAPMYMDPTDVGWMIEDDEVVHARLAPKTGNAFDDARTGDEPLDEPLELEMEADEPPEPEPAPPEPEPDLLAELPAPPVKTRAITVNPDGVNFDDATREYEGPRQGGGGRAQRVEPPLGDFATPEPVTNEFAPEGTPGFSASSQLTDIKRRDLGFVKPRAEPPELKMTLRTPDFPRQAHEDPTKETLLQERATAFERSFAAAEQEIDLPAGKYPPLVPIEPDDLIASLPSPKPAHVTRDLPPPSVKPATTPPETEAKTKRSALMAAMDSIDLEVPDLSLQGFDSAFEPLSLAEAGAEEEKPDTADDELPSPTAPTRDLTPETLQLAFAAPAQPATSTRDFSEKPTQETPRPAQVMAMHADPLISAPTRELGLRPGGRAPTEDEPTKMNPRIRGGTTQADPQGAKAAFDPIDARASQILEEIDEHAPADEAAEDRTRRRISTLLERATLWSQIDLDRSVAAVDLALSEDPNSALAQKLIHRNRDAIMGVFQAFLGDLDRQPELSRPLHELAAAPISPRAAFLLSRVDGTLSLDEILDVSGMPRLEAYRYLCQLFLRGILR